MPPNGDSWPPPPFGHMEAFGRSKCKSQNPLRPQGLLATGSNLARRRAAFGQGEFQQELTEKTEKGSFSLFSLFPPVSNSSSDP